MQIEISLCLMFFTQKTHFERQKLPAKKKKPQQRWTNFLPPDLFPNSTGLTPGAADLGVDGEFGADCPNAILVRLCQAQELRMDIRRPTTTYFLPQQDTSSNAA